MVRLVASKRIHNCPQFYKPTAYKPIQADGQRVTTPLSPHAFHPFTSHMIKLFARRIDRQFQKNHEQHVLADELVVRIQRMRECFLGNSLPFPTAEVNAAWNLLPNVMVDSLPNSMKTGLVFLRAPPPTPTGHTFDTDGATSSDPSSNGGHDDDDGWLFVEATISTTPDVVELRALEESAASEDDSMSRCSYPDQPLDQHNEEDLPRSTDSNSFSSDHESLSSSDEPSPTAVGFHNMVNQWLLDYRARGTDAFIESLIAFGAVSVGTARLASRVARAIVRKVAEVSHTEGKNLEKTIRLSALAAFKKYWEVVSQCCSVTVDTCLQRRAYRTIWGCHPLRLRRIPYYPPHTASTWQA